MELMIFGKRTNLLIIIPERMYNKYIESQEQTNQVYLGEEMKIAMGFNVHPASEVRH
jgi:hypothetical protein